MNKFYTALGVIIILCFVAFVINTIDNAFDFDIEVSNDNFHELHKWEVCDDEWKVIANDWEEHDNLKNWQKIEYRIVSDREAYVIFYEEDGGDVFNVTLIGDYSIMCASDRS